MQPTPPTLNEISTTGRQYFSIASLSYHTNFEIHDMVLYEQNIVTPTFVINGEFNTSAPLWCRINDTIISASVLANNVSCTFDTTLMEGVVDLSLSANEVHFVFVAQIRLHRPVPVVDSIEPAFGPAVGGTAVMLHGTYFVNQIDVYCVFGLHGKVRPVYISDSEMICISPAVMNVGVVNFALSLNEALVNTTLIFDYVHPPTLIDVEPQILIEGNRQRFSVNGNWLDLYDVMCEMGEYKFGYDKCEIPEQDVGEYTMTFFSESYPQYIWFFTITYLPNISIISVTPAQLPQSTNQSVTVSLSHTLSENVIVTCQSESYDVKLENESEFELSHEITDFGSISISASFSSGIEDSIDVYIFKDPKVSHVFPTSFYRSSHPLLEVFGSFDSHHPAIMCAYTNLIEYTAIWIDSSHIICPSPEYIPRNYDQIQLCLTYDTIDYFSR